MKRSYRFVSNEGAVRCDLGYDQEITLPVFPGILKHPTVDELRQLLTKPAVARKYTILALRKAPWPVLGQFPRAWLESLLPDANLRPERERALRFLLS